MKTLRAALICSAASLAIPAHAGEEVLYEAAPQWVVDVDFQAALDKEGSPVTILRDWQYRLEDGVVTSYSDGAARMDNPQTLMQLGTLTLDWLPDKGDLRIHRLEIHRDSEVIDLIAQGETFDVIRREQGLEQRLLDGQLTATLAIPGLREGDVMHLSYSTTLDDQALGDEVQAAQFLPSDGFQVGQARAIVSWPVDEEIYWAAEERAGVEEPVERDGYKWLEVDLPLAERPPLPRDTPSRYRRPEVLRVGSFASWEELSDVMTPHFEQAAQLSAGSDVAWQADAIMARTDDPVERMALATQLVQDEVSYLLDGLDGGNYLPQAAEDTWEMRYGDCKAKSVLLLSLLREMGIESEVVLVTTQGGDAIPELLPLPLSFNHMIVHAVVDGQDYWLDGTSSATRVANVGDVPPFFWALPLREGGTGLMEMAQRDLAVPRTVITVDLDHSAGTDFPALFTMEMQLSGPAGAPFRAMADAQDEDALRQMSRALVGYGGVEGTRVSDVTVDYDAEEAVATLVVKGVANSMFEWRDGRMELDVEQGIDASSFNPDRARPAWRDLPVATQGPDRSVFEIRMKLPDGGESFVLDGDTSASGGFGNLRVEREAHIEDDLLVARAETFEALGEIAPEDLADARRAARRMQNSKVELASPVDVTWRWELDAEERAARAEPIVAAFTDAIEFADEDDYSALQSRAMFLENIYQYEAALADYTVLADETPSPWVFHRRSAVLEALGRRGEAIADMQAAYDLNPENGTAFALARLLAYDGQIKKAEEVLAYLAVSDEEELTLADLMATVTGLDGQVDEGLTMLADHLGSNPADANALNSDCWYRGLFNVALDDAVALCTRAVERATFAAAPLDSRALVRYRLGMMDEALEDIDAALEVAPHLAPSMYLRGVIRLSTGDEHGTDDIATALGMAPQLEDFYARHGIVPPAS